MKITDNRAPVASYIITHCPKCDNDVNHVVVAHDISGFVVKVRCIVCSSEHKFVIPKTGAARLAAARTAKPKTVSKGSYLKLLEDAKTSAKNKVPVQYDMHTHYELQTLIKHSTLGEGVVIKVLDTKIEAIFSDGIKLLVHSKAV